MHLGLSDDDFFVLTPRQLHVLLGAHRERVRHDELLAGIVAACVVNHSMAPPKRAAVPSDFMPCEWENRQRQKPERLNRKRVASQVRSFLEGQAKTLGMLRLGDQP